MKSLPILSSLFVAVAACAQPAVPQIAFDSVPDALKLPKDLYLGEASGVAVNSKGHVFVFSRGNTTGPAYAAAAAQLLEFDADGRFVREIGKNLYAWSFAHTVRVDRDDNIWCTDKGSDLVIKFSPEGKVLMILGRKQEASDEDTAPLKHPKPPLPAEDGRFRQVTDVTWDPAGNIFVSDGYINSRVAKIDKNGNWLTSWGTRGDKPGEFNTPHSIAADAQGNIYVADRFNRRIQVFDGEGKFLRAPGHRRSVRQGHQAGDRQPGRSERHLGHLCPWRALGDLHHPGAEPGALQRRCLPGPDLQAEPRRQGARHDRRAGRQLKQFAWVHEIACPSENVLYVAELLTWRVQKLLLHPN